MLRIAIRQNISRYVDTSMKLLKIMIIFFLFLVISK